MLQDYGLIEMYLFMLWKIYIATAFLCAKQDNVICNFAQAVECYFIAIDKF